MDKYTSEQAGPESRGLNPQSLYTITTVIEAAQTLVNIYPDPFYETARRKSIASQLGCLENTRFWHEVEALIRRNLQ